MIYSHYIISVLHKNTFLQTMLIVFLKCLYSPFWHLWSVILVDLSFPWTWYSTWVSTGPTAEVRYSEYHWFLASSNKWQIFLRIKKILTVDLKIKSDSWFQDNLNFHNFLPRLILKRWKFSVYYYIYNVNIILYIIYSNVNLVLFLNDNLLTFSVCSVCSIS